MTSVIILIFMVTLLLYNIYPDKNVKNDLALFISDNNLLYREMYEKNSTTLKVYMNINNEFRIRYIPSIYNSSEVWKVTRIQ